MFESLGMVLLRFVAKTSTLLHRHGEIWSNQCLKVAETTNDSTIVPRIRVRMAKGVLIQEIVVTGRGVMHFCARRGGVKANKVKDATDHTGLGEGKAAVNITSEPCTKVILKYAVRSELKFLA